MAAELAKFRVAFIIVSQLTLPLKCLFIQDGQLPETAKSFFYPPKPLSRIAYRQVSMNDNDHFL